MASANAQIGVADAAFYPNLTLSAARRTRKLNLVSISLTGQAASGQLAPTVSETIFDAGLRRATVNQYIATYNADVANYRQTVLTAFPAS